VPIPQHCPESSRLHALEHTLKAAARLSSDGETMIHLANMALHVARRLNAHEECCTLCLGERL
jgi:hypothetical protein